MPKLLIVGDLHHGPNLEQIESAIEREQPDQTIFLGDYFDQFDDQVEHARRTAWWLKGSLTKPARVHLFGNHDLPYAHPGRAHCPGFDPAKMRVIRSVLDDSEWAKLHLWHHVEDWLFSHAGLSRLYMPRKRLDLPSYLRSEEQSAWKALHSGQEHWIWNVGEARGGGAQCGGLLWCDWDYEFEPVPGLNQVCGHTPGTEFRAKTCPNSQNWCIDVSDRFGVSNVLSISDGAETVVRV